MVISLSKNHVLSVFGQLSKLIFILRYWSLFPCLLPSLQNFCYSPPPIFQPTQFTLIYSYRKCFGNWSIYSPVMSDKVFFCLFFYDPHLSDLELTLMDQCRPHRGSFSTLSRLWNCFKGLQMVKGFKSNNSATFPAFILFTIGEIAGFSLDGEFSVFASHVCCLHWQWRNSRLLLLPVFKRNKVCDGMFVTKISKLKIINSIRNIQIEMFNGCHHGKNYILLARECACIFYHL